MQLINDAELEWSSVVANNAMNRGRVAVGVNSYEKDLNLNIIEYIHSQQVSGVFKWLDLCCGEGNALIQTARHFLKAGLKDKIQIKGIDLVDYFNPEYRDYPDMLEFACLNLSRAFPSGQYDLITSVHGLHYIGDKLKVIRKAGQALKEKGLFLANLDLNNIILANAQDSDKTLKDYFKKNKISFHSQKRLLKIEGNKSIKSDFTYLGSDDKAGPNYTGQAAVNSIYK